MEISSHVCHKRSVTYVTKRSVTYNTSLLSRNEFHRYIKTVKTVGVFISIRQVNTSVNISSFQHLGDMEVNDLKK